MEGQGGGRERAIEDFMNRLLQRLLHNPVYVRVIPFCLFAGLTFCQGLFGDAGRYWIYTGKTLVGVWMLTVIWKWIPELRWKFSWEAGVAGVLVFVIWVGLDPFYPKLSSDREGWNPHGTFGAHSPLAWAFIVGRIAGSTLVVPALEEVFYRSFLYRWIVNVDFQTVPFKQFHLPAFIITGVFFGLAHFEWLAGILCAFVYQGLACHKNRLGDAMTAHAITNFLLGLWVVWRGAWHFW